MDALIIFKDGSVLAAELNGSSLIVASKPTFPDDLSYVRVVAGSYIYEFHDASISECASIDGRYWFCFTEESELERIIRAQNEQIMLLEDALCEQDAANEERLAAIEDALCELDKEE